jgi:hypothetical protein
MDGTMNPCERLLLAAALVEADPDVDLDAVLPLAVRSIEMDAAVKARQRAALVGPAGREEAA